VVSVALVAACRGLPFVGSVRFLWVSASVPFLRSGLSCSGCRPCLLSFLLWSFLRLCGCLSLVLAGEGRPFWGLSSGVFLSDLSP